MDSVSRMTALLSELRRERNGAVADTMFFYGTPFGLNLGVSIPTIRSVAAREGRDGEFAEYLYKQDVRELRIAALCIADPERVTADNLDFWAAGIINSEIAEQAAMLLLCRTACVDLLLERWSASGDMFLGYAALMSAARNSSCNADSVLTAVERCLESFPEKRLTAQGAVAAVAALNAREPERVKDFVKGVGRECEASKYLLDELEWMIAE